jgi:quercetin dioxygenase-like cupin family protein
MCSMLRSWVPLVVILALLGPAVVQAEDATPAPAAANPLAGIAIEVLGGGAPSAVPDQALGLFRVTFTPGATMPFHNNPASAQIVAVEAGTIELTAMQEGGQLTQVWAANGTPAAAAPIAPADVIVLQPGDSSFFPQSTVHYLHNPGDEPAVILVTTLVAAGQPLVVWTNEQGTPIP